LFDLIQRMRSIWSVGARLHYEYISEILRDLSPPQVSGNHPLYPFDIIELLQLY